MKNKKVQFAFSYGSTNEKACYAFYVADEKCHCDFTDDEGVHHSFSGKPMPEGFWDKLAEIAEKHEMFQWKAHKLFKRFVLDLSAGVLNVEVLFPDGRKINANSMHGEPNNLAEVAADLKALFTSLE